MQQGEKFKFKLCVFISQGNSSIIYFVPKPLVISTHTAVSKSFLFTHIPSTLLSPALGIPCYAWFIISAGNFWKRKLKKRLELILKKVTNILSSVNRGKPSNEGNSYTHPKNCKQKKLFVWQRESAYKCKISETSPVCVGTHVYQQKKFSCASLLSQRRSGPWCMATTHHAPSRAAVGEKFQICPGKWEKGSTHTKSEMQAGAHQLGRSCWVAFWHMPLTRTAGAHDTWLAQERWTLQKGTGAQSHNFLPPSASVRLLVCAAGKPMFEGKQRPTGHRIGAPQVASKTSSNCRSRAVSPEKENIYW